MLQNLHVKNLALIDEAEVDFSGGLNILTGETGAGKSIILGSVSLALGGRYSADMLRKGADKGLVELTFYVENPETVRKLEEMDLSPDGGQIIITRRFNGNRSVSRINGETVTLGRLKEAAQVLIDIHGQHEHQSLLYKKNHLAILDAFAKEAGEWKKKVADSYREYRRLEKELKEADKDEAERAKEISFLEFEIDEIENAGITAAECQSVEEDYRRMMQGKRIAENLEEAYLYTAGEGGISAAEAIGRAVRAAAVAAEHDDKSGELYEQLVEVENLIGDSGRELRCYLDSLSFEPEQFYETESRLNQINHLKVKYGDSAEAILQHKADDEERLLNPLCREERHKVGQRACQIVGVDSHKFAAERTEKGVQQASVAPHAVPQGFKEVDVLPVQVQHQHRSVPERVDLHGEINEVHDNGGYQKAVKKIGCGGRRYFFLYVAEKGGKRAL